MGAPEIEQFLNHLAVDKKVAAGTQNQALSALVFLYHEVLRQEFEWLENLEHAKRPIRLPVVLTETEVRAVLAHQEFVTASDSLSPGARAPSPAQRAEQAQIVRGSIVSRA